MGKNNYPTGKLDEVPAEFTHETIQSLNDLYGMGKPENDEEVKERIDKYFEFCENSSIRPGVESLGLALSVSRQTLLNWQNGVGCSKERQDLIIKAKGFISAFIEQIMLSNRVYPATGIFLLKNWCGYRDTVEVEPVQQQDREIMSRQAIQDILARHQGKKPEKPSYQELLDSLPD